MSKRVRAAAGVLLAWWCCAAGFAVIPQQDGAMTQQEYAKVRASAWRQLLLTQYDGVVAPRGDWPWTPPQREFLESVADQLASLPTAPGWAKLAEQADALVNAGGELHPIIRYFYGRTLQERGKLHEALLEILIASQHMRVNGDGIHPYLRAIAVQRTYDLNLELGGGDLTHLCPIYSNHYAWALASVPEEGNESRVLVEMLYQQMFSRISPQEHISLYQNMKEHGTDSKWVLNLVGGRAHIQLAWNMRGGGFAHTVTSEGWRQFQQQMTIARDLLLAAHAAHPERPEAATNLITVAMAGHARPGETVRHWFDQAVKAHFDHMPAYDALFWAYRPRWEGSAQKLLEFGEECLATGRFDTYVPHKYWYAVWAVLDEMHDNYEILFKQRKVTDPLLKMVDGYLATPNQAPPDRQVYWQSFKAAVAWRAGRFTEAAAALDAAAALGVENTAYTVAVFGDVQTIARLAVGETRALTDEAMKGKLAAIDTLLAGSQTAEAKQQFEALAAVAPQESELRQYLLHRAELARQLDELKIAAQTRIQPRGSDAGWEIRTGSWYHHADGSLEGTGHNDGRGVLYLSHLPLTGDFEFTCKVEFAESTHGLYNAGIFFGPMEMRPSVVFTLYRSRQTAGIHIPPNEPEHAPQLSIADANTVRLRFEGGKLNVWVNDAQAVTDMPIPPLPSSKGLRIGVGNYFSAGPVRFRDMTVRRLNGPGIVG